MKEASEVIEQISSTSSSIAKLDILRKNADVPGLKEILKFIYNPYCKTGISTTKLSNGMQSIPANAPFEIIMYTDAIEYFSKHQTGSSADAAFGARFVRSTLQHYGTTAMRTAIAIVTQELRIGISTTTLNKAYGADFIPKTGCMLGTLYDNVGASKVQWPCVVTEKLDGVRRVLIKENGVCNVFSRSGHEDNGLVEIIAEAQYLPDNFVYDGELLAMGTFNDSIAQRQATNSIASLKGRKTGLTFNIFDMVPVSDFYAGICKIPAKERKIRLGATLHDTGIRHLDDDWARRICAFGITEELQHIKAVPILGLVNNLTEVEPIVASIWQRGGEGVMLNTATGPYEIKRSKNLLKIKHTEEKILTVVDMLEGTGKYEDTLGALVVSYKGSLVGVGTGFTDYQRTFIWNNPKRFIGRKIEIETFGESVNANGSFSLNCPVYKRFVGENE